MNTAIQRTSGIVSKEDEQYDGLTAEQVIDELRVIVPNGRMAVVLHPTFDQKLRVAFDPGWDQAWVQTSEAFVRWIVGYATLLRAPRVPRWLKALLPVDRVVVIPVRWRDWVAGAIVVEAVWLDNEHIEALKDYAANLAARVATDDWMARTQGSSGVLVRLPLAAAG